MGVTGSGKSTIGALLAERMDVPFVEGDDFHPASNIAKMAGGLPLTDEDREPWLASLNRRFGLADAGAGCVASCSALKVVYRDRLGQGITRPYFVLLDGTEAELSARLAQRHGHFMNPSLLQSQLALLERGGIDLTLSISQSPEALVATIVETLGKAESGDH